jgi:hypothetical protein
VLGGGLAASGWGGGGVSEFNGNNIVTVQLTVPALTKLFDGDPEIGIHLRKSVVAAFARQKIGNVLDAASKAQIAFEVEHQVGKISGYPSKVILNPTILNEIKAAAGQAIIDAHREIRELIKVAIDDQMARIEGVIKSEVASCITGETKRKINSEVRSRLDAALSAARV